MIIFILFFLVSFFILMQIYRLSTFHGDFLKTLPILIGYGILVSYLFIYLNLSQNFLWYLIFAVVLLGLNYKKQKKFKFLETLTENEEEKKFLDKSLRNTLKFHLLSSIVYIFTFLISFIYLFNKGL